MTTSTRRLLVPVVIGAIWLPILKLNCAAQTSSPDRELVREIDRYMNATTRSGLFMGAILVARDGKIIIKKGYGMANLEYEIANTATTKFDIASISKTFIATLILVLHEKGTLNIQDPICKYLDDCPDQWRDIRISHLLTHTSGIINYTELPDQYEMRALPSFMPDALRRIRKMPLQFKPGEKFSYSNTGYKLLERIIERASGRRFDSNLQEYILAPLGMEQTGVFDQPGIRHLILKNRAAGYTDGVGPLENCPWVDSSYGGGMYSTAEDMYLWGSSFFTGKLLSKKTLDQALTPFQSNYGYGWFIFNSAKHKFVMHGGNIPGYGLTLALYPEEKLVIFVASNLDTAPTGRIHDDIVKMIFGEKYELPPQWTVVKVDPSIYDPYVGRYRKTDNPDFVITITKENDQLWNRLGDDPGAATMVLRPLSETRFFNKMFVLYEVNFVKNDTGRVSALIADGPWGRGEFKRIE